MKENETQDENLDITETENLLIIHSEKQSKADETKYTIKYTKER